GLWVVHTEPDPLFTTGSKDRGKGLEPLAEEGNPAVFAAAVRSQRGIVASGTFMTPVGDAMPGPATPGKVYEFSFTAEPGQRLTFATMFGQSNDVFLAPGDRGIKLFDSKGDVMSGDITSLIYLWDAGTEVNQEPGLGPDQAPRQAAPNTGASERNPVRLVTDVRDGFRYPKVAEILRVTVTPAAATAMD
ncbi:MAG: spondin domain-containing protein, partial [Gemmatimonadales bacterium]